MRSPRRLADPTHPFHVLIASPPPSSRDPLPASLCACSSCSFLVTSSEALVCVHVSTSGCGGARKHNGHLCWLVKAERRGSGAGRGGQGEARRCQRRREARTEGEARGQGEAGGQEAGRRGENSRKRLLLVGWLEAALTRAGHDHRWVCLGCGAAVGALPMGRLLPLALLLGLSRLG